MPFDSLSRWQKRKETFKEFQIPYNRHLLLSGKVQVPGQGRWTEQLLHLQDLNFNHIYTTIPRWSPVEGFPQVCCSCSRPTDGTPAPPPPPSSSRSAYCLRWTKLHFCLFLRRGHQQTPWGEQNDVLFLTIILIGTLLISKVIEAQHLSKNIQYVAVESSSNY